MNARTIITHAFHSNSAFSSLLTISCTTAKLPSYSEHSARRKLPRDFSPPAFPTKVRKLRVGDFEVVRGQASLTAEAQETRLFCSVSLNFSVSRLPSRSPVPGTTRSSRRARFTGRSVSRPTPGSGGVRRYYLSCEYQTRAGAALYYNLLTDVIITIPYK